MSFSENSGAGTADTLQFILAVFNMNGTFEGYESLDSQLLMCDPTLQGNWNGLVNKNWVKFGVGQSLSYSCSIEKFFQSPTLKFYELFLVDIGNGNALTPVPVLVLNYRDSNGATVNQNAANSDIENDKLSNRFFLVDSMSGIKTGDSSPTVIRYASSITISVSMAILVSRILFFCLIVCKLQIKSQESSSNLIYPPLLTIKYTDTMVRLNTGNCAKSQGMTFY